MSQNIALMQMKISPREEGGASRAQVKTLAVLAFVNKHPLISTSLLNLSQFKVSYLIILCIINVHI